MRIPLFSLLVLLSIPFVFSGMVDDKNITSTEEGRVGRERRTGLISYIAPTVREKRTDFFGFVDAVSGSDVVKDFTTNISQAPSFQSLNFALTCLQNFEDKNSLVKVNLFLIPFDGCYNASISFTKPVAFSIKSNSSRSASPPSFPDVNIVPTNISEGVLAAFNSEIELDLLCISNSSKSAICCSQDTVLNITRSVFLKNRLSNGANTNPFSQNTMGGAVWFNGGSLNITNCTFTENESLNGGSITLISAANTLIQKNTFFKNSATNQGGAIYGIYLFVTKIESNTFSENDALEGGVIYFTIVGEKSAPVVILNNLFSNNSAISIGGATFFSFSYLLFSNNKFQNNFAALQGGAIYSSSTSFNASNSQFSMNGIGTKSAFTSCKSTSSSSSTKKISLYSHFKKNGK